MARQIGREVYPIGPSLLSWQAPVAAAWAYVNAIISASIKSLCLLLFPGDLGKPTTIKEILMRLFSLLAFCSSVAILSVCADDKVPAEQIPSTAPAPVVNDTSATVESAPTAEQRYC